MSILKRPWITNKTAALHKKGVYGFIVASEANKITIKQAVENTYGVVVDEVNTLRYAGKRKSRYTRAGLITGRRTAYKKALVALRSGETIDVYQDPR